MRQNRQCICCGTKYSYCPSCSNVDKLKPSWYSEFCCEECKELWHTATKYNVGMITKDEAASIISAMALKDKATYAKCIQRDLGNILKEEPKPDVEVVAAVAAPIAPEVVEEEIKPVFKKQTYRKKIVAEPIEHEVVETIE